MTYGAKDVLNIMHTMAEIDTYTMMLVNASNRKYVGLFKRELENTINKMRGNEIMKSLSVEEINNLQSENEKLKAENEELQNCDKTAIYKRARINFDKLKQLKQENEELKSNLEQQRNYIVGYKNFSIEKLMKLEQKFEEIKETVSESIAVNEYATPLAKAILQIIESEDV